MANRTHIYQTCKNPSCASHKDKSLGNFYGDPLHLISVEEGRLYSKCEVCSHEQGFKDPDNKRKLKYPQLNASTGEVFKSRDEEKSYAKKNGLEAVS